MEERKPKKGDRCWRNIGRLQSGPEQRGTVLVAENLALVVELDTGARLHTGAHLWEGEWTGAAEPPRAA